MPTCRPIAANAQLRLPRRDSPLLSGATLGLRPAVMWVGCLASRLLATALLPPLWCRWMQWLIWRDGPHAIDAAWVARPPAATLLGTPPGARWPPRRRTWMRTCLRCQTSQSSGRAVSGSRITSRSCGHPFTRRLGTERCTSFSSGSHDCGLSMQGPPAWESCLLLSSQLCGRQSSR
jgi:hypothetical protein